MIEIILAGEPVGKGRPRFSRKSGTVYTPEKTARFEERLGWAAQQIMRGRPLLTGPVWVVVDLYVNIPASKSKKWKTDALSGTVRPIKKPDIDNALKGIFDALNKVVWVDDCQIVEERGRKFYSDQPRIELRISEKEWGLFD